MNYNKDSSKKEEYKKIVKKVCPECGRENCTKYDELHAETYCKYCGLVLTAQYTQCHIIFPGLKKIIIKIRIDDDSAHKQSG